MLEKLVAESRLAINAVQDDIAALKDVIRDEIVEKMELLDDKLSRLDADFEVDLGDEE
jgi:chloramphenicol 3-O-phosphotransferase